MADSPTLEMQKGLNILGYGVIPESGTADAAFDKARIAFQQANGLPTTGAWPTVTLLKIRQMVANAKAASASAVDVDSPQAQAMINESKKASGQSVSIGDELAAMSTGQKFGIAAIAVGLLYLFTRKR